MKTHLSRRGFAMLLALAAVPHLVWADDVMSGEWTLRPAEESGKVELSLSGRSGRGTYSNSTAWPVGDLKGLVLGPLGRRDVNFVIARDAGRFDADGVVTGSEGAGFFHFTPAPEYAAAMGRAGFAGVTPDRQLSLALHDVSLAFARDMKQAKLDDIDLDGLVAFRIHKVDLAYITAMRAEGMKTTRAKNWIAFRIHGATAEFVRGLRIQGYTPDDQELITLRIHDVTPEYIVGLKAHGLQNLTLEQIIRLKIHGIS